MAEQKAVAHLGPRDERFPEFLSSSVLTAASWTPGTRPTIAHGGVWHG